MLSNTGRAARGRSPGSPVSSALAEALKELVIEATLLHWHVAAASRLLAGPDDLTNAQVSILRSVHADGPQTVPQLAAARAVSRQSVQRSVDALLARELVALEPNPRHKRSRLVAATPRGLRRLAQMERRQSAWVAELADGLGAAGLRRASRLLRRIRQRISTRFALRAPGE